MARYVYACQRYPQLQVGPQSAGLRFRDGKFETDDRTQAALLDGLHESYGVTRVEAPQDPSGTGEDGPGGEDRPARTARKADWLAYAAAVDPDADLDGLTKDELIDRYGGDE